MRLANILRNDGKRSLAVSLDNNGLLDVNDLIAEPIASIREALSHGPEYLRDLDRAAKTADSSFAFEPDTIDQYLPVAEHDSKIFCVGLNYVSHAEELGVAIPKEPSIFARYGTTCIGHEETICLPTSSHAVDWEGELAIVIGSRGRYVKESDALSLVAGVTVFNDVSMRDFQERLPKITLAKNFDGSGPMGPHFVSLSEVSDLNNLTVETRVNGEVKQKASTSEFIFSIPFLVSLISDVCELSPGDVISTGTPGGVGWASKPPVYLKDGDTVEVEISGVGTLRNPVGAETGTLGD